MRLEQWKALMDRHWADSWVNDRGARVFDLGNRQNVERYAFDFDMCSSSHGWEQYDTSQDAPYFGTWAHERWRLVVTFCEGDLSLVSCPTGDAYRRELASMAETYGDAPHYATAIDMDEGTVTRLYAERPTGEEATDEPV